MFKYMEVEKMAETTQTTIQNTTGTEGQNNNANNNQQNTQQNVNQNTNSQAQQNTQQTTQVEQKDTLKEFLKKMGVENESEITSVWDAHKKAEEAKKDDLTKANDKVQEITKKYVEAENRAIMAEAKLEAIKLGAKADLVDDLVIVAKSKVTGDKKIEDVISEMKTSGSIYFATEDEGQKKTTITRKSVGSGTQNNQQKSQSTNNTNQQKNNNQSNQGNENKYAGTIAERLFNNRPKTKKKSYFGN